MRLFGRAAPWGSNKGRKPSKAISVRLLLPSHGALRMVAQRIDSGPRDGVEQPQFMHQEMNGEVEIRVERGSGRVQCRAIRVTLRLLCRLNMGPKRGWEKDTLFERVIENRGAIVLEEGVQRFKFTIMVPFGLAGFDVHPQGDTRLSLVAEVEGLSGDGGSALPSPGVDVPAGAYLWKLRRSSSPSTPSLAESDDAPPPLEIRPAMLVSWSDPVGGQDEEIPWMTGVERASRCVCLVYNPDPAGGVTSLDLKKDGDVPGLGVFTAHLMSDVWTVCALLKTHLLIPAPSPAATIYYTRTVLQQIATFTSPRDDESVPPLVTSTPFLIWELGTRPSTQSIGQGFPAIWRGTEAGGHDSEGLSLIRVGRLPNDETGRPSTLPEVLTPIVVTHKLVVEVYYSINGEDVAGNPLPKHAPQAVRLLRIDKPVFVPSCGCIPESIELPTYDDTLKETLHCPTCKLLPNEQVCRACDLTSLLHPRHDLLQYGPSGTCPECDIRFLQSDEKSKWADCACGLNFNDMMDRMTRVIPADVDGISDTFSDLSFQSPKATPA